MLFSIYRLGPSLRLVSLATLLTFLIQSSALFAESLQNGTTEDLIAEFDTLESSLKYSDEPFLEAYQFLKSFVKKINEQHGISLTLVQASKLVDAHLNEFALPKEAKSSLTGLIEFIYMMDTPSKNMSLNIDFHIWHRKIFGAFSECSWLNWFKSSSSVNDYNANTRNMLLAIDQDPPDGVVIGLVEIFAGALLCVIPTQATWTLGSGLILDGIIRAVGATQEVAGDRESQDPITETTNSKSIDRIASVNCKINAWRRGLLFSAL